jgi:uncharacterized membrane protein YbhN (UPF0104 family)
MIVKIEKLTSISNYKESSYIFIRNYNLYMPKKSIKIILSVLLVLLSYGFIIFKFVQFDSLKEFDFKIMFIDRKNPAILIAVLLLMPLNWSIEAIKWEKLMQNIQPLNFAYSFKAVFAGITLGIFTPNRIGEIGGRILFLEKGKRSFGFLATSMGSFAQLITTILAGLIGFSLFLIIYPEKIWINPIFNKITLFIVILFLLFLFLVYFNFKRIKPFLFKFSFFRNRENQINYFSETKTKLLLKVLVLSILRYIIFMFQFYLLLYFFDNDLSLIQAYISISLIYLFSTLIPTTTLLEFGIKGSLAIFFIGIFSTNLLGIVLTTILIWIINLAIPSIIGSIFFVKNNLY